MRKIRFLALIVGLFVSLFVGAQITSAAQITECKYENSKIYLSGTGDTRVQIVLFGQDNAPMYMTTAAVENGKFSMVFPEIANLKDGEYTIKVADYNGKNIDSAKITVKTTAGVATGENMTWCVLAVILVTASLGVLVAFSAAKKRKFDSKR